MPDFVIRHGRGALLVVAIALVFSILGVYGTDEQPFLRRFLLWCFSIGVGAVSSLVVAPLVFDKQPMADWTPWLQVPVAAAIISFPVTGALLLLDASDGYTAPLATWPYYFGTVFVISLLITIGSFFLSSFETRRGEQESGTGAVSDPTGRFMERLPAKYRGAHLFAVSSEDHYLRVHTSLGEELILMRLADAVDLLSQADGLQVHRSWWVSLDGVADVHAGRERAGSGRGRAGGGQREEEQDRHGASGARERG